MPHTPRRTPIVASELMPPPAAAHRPLPAGTPAPEGPPTGKAYRLRPAPVSVRNFSYDQDKIVEAMLGKDVHADPLTGQLVYPVSAGQRRA